MPSDGVCATYVVIPAYNEEKIIRKVVSGVFASGYSNVIVVDDGSRDATEAEAKKTGAIVLTHRVNRGKGAAVKTGVAAARICGAKCVVTMDGDGQHDESDLNAMVVPVISGETDVVLGTRFFGGNEIPAVHIWFNKVGNFLSTIITGVEVKDSQSGFRAFSARAADAVSDAGDGYEYDTEVIRQIRRNKLRFKEVPIRVYYNEHSKNKVDKQNLENGVKTFIRLMWNIFS